jgi:ureidoglycolate lyase
MITVTAAPLTAEAFAPFGEVLGAATAEPRRYSQLAFDAEPPARPRLWVSSDLPVARLPLRLARMERHPWSAQSFVPLTQGRYLVAVAHGTAAGGPDLATLRAFIATGAGICYRRGVWHHGLMVLDPGGRFVVVMATTSHADDDIFLDLATPTEIIA